MSVIVAYDVRVSFEYPKNITPAEMDSLLRELFGWCDEMDSMPDPTVRVVTDDKAHAYCCDKELQTIITKYGGRVL